MSKPRKLTKKLEQSMREGIPFNRLYPAWQVEALFAKLDAERDKYKRWRESFETAQ